MHRAVAVPFGSPWVDASSKSMARVWSARSQTHKQCPRMCPCAKAMSSKGRPCLPAGGANGGCVLPPGARDVEGREMMLES